MVRPSRAKRQKAPKKNLEMSDEFDDSCFAATSRKPRSKAEDEIDLTKFLIVLELYEMDASKTTTDETFNAAEFALRPKVGFRRVVRRTPGDRNDGTGDSPEQETNNEPMNFVPESDEDDFALNHDPAPELFDP